MVLVLEPACLKNPPGDFDNLQSSGNTRVENKSEKFIKKVEQQQKENVSVEMINLEEWGHTSNPSVSQ